MRDAELHFIIKAPYIRIWLEFGNSWSQLGAFGSANSS